MNPVRETIHMLTTKAMMNPTTLLDDDYDDENTVEGPLPLAVKL